MSEREDLMRIENGLDEQLRHILAEEAIQDVNRSDEDEEDFDMKVHFHDEKTDDELMKELLNLIPS